VDGGSRDEPVVCKEDQAGGEQDKNEGDKFLLHAVQYTEGGRR
jgi:hypothetical protein